MRDEEISIARIEMYFYGKATFRELSFYSYLNDFKEKLLINLVVRCFYLLLLFFQWKVDNTVACKNIYNSQMYHL